MKLILFLAISALSISHLEAQMPDAGSSTSDPQPPAGATIITSDEMNMDQATHTSVFTGSVVVIGENFKMTCNEMTVYSTTANKIEHIVAKENVVIIQPDRITHCGQAVYTRNDDKFDLTDQPDILDNKNEIQAPEIYIFRTQKKLVTKGRSTVKIIEKSGATNSTTAAAAGTPK